MTLTMVAYRLQRQATERTFSFYCLFAVYSFWLFSIIVFHVGGNLNDKSINRPS